MQPKSANFHTVPVEFREEVQRYMLRVEVPVATLLLIEIVPKAV